VAVVAVGCGGPTPVRERFNDARVEVTLHLERSGDGMIVVAEFRPLEDGLHLYGGDLPMAGIDGAGRPTRVDVVDAAWRAVGQAHASVQAEDVTLAGFDEPFPVYPDGPVTLRQAVESIGGADDGQIDLSITFMACSSAGLCFAPVENDPMSLPSR
jgi:hypothetical protein